jgi:8-oxo-dGTP pyrophosphatase MutT (NUDIX family)
MEFKNRPNTAHIVFKSKFVNAIIKFFSKLFKKSTRLVWESRSVAVNGVVIIFLPDNPIPYVLVSKRGPAAADYRGLMNLIAGYMDWDESGPEALYREAWEEVGIDLKSMVYPEKDKDCLWNEIISNNIEQPWHVKTEPDENRQNISLRYGAAFRMKESVLPELSLENNEVEGEVEHAEWLPANQIDQHQWAFDHDKVIKEYLVKIGDHFCNY